MYLLRVTSPAGDDFVSLGETKKQAMAELIGAYKGFYHMTEEDLKEDHEYNSFEKYFADYLGIGIYTISVGESVVLGYDAHFKNGKRTDLKGD